MAAEAMIAAQIVRLLRQHPPAVWDLVDADGPARVGDVVLRDPAGAPIAYARPATAPGNPRV